MKNASDVAKRLERYEEEKKRMTPQRSWESGYLIGIIDTLKWMLDGEKPA